LLSIINFNFCVKNGLFGEKRQKYCTLPFYFGASDLSNYKETAF